MSNTRHEVRLSAEEVECLKEISGSDAQLLNLLVPQLLSNGSRKIVIRVDVESAERFRELLTERLAQVGFDADYNVNSQGRMLEALIDHFIFPTQAKRRLEWATRDRKAISRKKSETLINRCSFVPICDAGLQKKSAQQVFGNVADD